MPRSSPTTSWEINLSVVVTVRLLLHRTLLGDTKITTRYWPCALKEILKDAMLCFSTNFSSDQEVIFIVWWVRRSLEGKVMKKAVQRSFLRERKN